MRLVAALVIVAASCGPPEAPRPQPTIVLSPARPSADCEESRRLRVRASAHADEGKLLRARREVERARAICPRDAAASNAIAERIATSLDAPGDPEALLKDALVARGREARELFDRVETLLERAGTTPALRVPEPFQPTGGLRFSPDASRIFAVAGADVARIDLATGARALLRDSDEDVWDLAVSPDGALVAASGESYVAVWRADTGELLAHEAIDAPGLAAAIDFTRDGKAIVFDDKDDLVIWDVTARRRRGTVKGAANAGRGAGATFVWLDGGALVATRQDSGMLTIADVATASAAARLDVYDYVVSADERVLVAPKRGTAATFVVWDVKKRVERGTVASPRCTSPDAIALSRDGSRLFVGAEGPSLCVFDLATRALVRTMAVPDRRRGDTIRELAISSDGRTLTIDRRAFDLVTARYAREPETPPNPMRPRPRDPCPTLERNPATVTSPGGAWIAGQGEPGRPCVWRADGTLLAPRPAPLPRDGESIDELQFSGRGLVASFADGSARRYDPDASEPARAVTPPASAMWPQALTLMADGAVRLAMRVDQETQVLDSRGSVVLRIPSTGASVATSSDGRWTAIAANDALILYDHDKEVRRIPASSVNGLALAPSGAIAVVTRGPYVDFIDVATGTTLGQTRARDDVTYASFSRDGKTLALVLRGATYLADVDKRQIDAAPIDAGQRALLAGIALDRELLAVAPSFGSVRVYDVARRALVSSIAHKGWITAVALSGDARLVAVGGRRGDVTLYRVDSGAALGTIALRHTARGDAWTVSSPDGRARIVGDDPELRALATCRVGLRFLPLEVCDERWFDDALWSSIFAR